MFLSGIGNAQERKARQGGAGASGAKDDELEALLSELRVDDEDGTSMKRKKAGELPILYSKELFQAKIDRDAAAARAAAVEAPSSSSSSPSSSSSRGASTQFVPREHILRYFAVCARMMATRSNVEEIVEHSWRNGVALHIAAMDFQKDVMEYSFQIERSFGCQYISVLNTSDDTELIEAAADFMFACLQCFLAAVRLRAKRYYAGQRRTTGGMSKATVLEFFEACNALMAMPDTKVLSRPPICTLSRPYLIHLMAMPDTKAALQKEFTEVKKGKSPPNEKVIALQRGVLVWLGMDPDYGVSRLNRLNKDFGTDQEVMVKMQHFAMAAQVACREAMMRPEERTAFYAEIPPWMRHCPFAYVMQKNAAAQQHHHHAMHGHSHGPGGTMPMPMLSPQEMAQRQAAFQADPQKRALMQAFAARLPALKAAIEPEVGRMSPQERKDFVARFADHPALAQVNAAGADPFARMAKLMALNDADVREVLKMQCVVAAHVQGGGRLETLLPPVTNDAAGAGPSSTNQLHSFLSGGGGMGAPPGAGGGAPAAKTAGDGQEKGLGHDHSHGHGHVHGPHCTHGSHENVAPTATGESAGASHDHSHDHASDDSKPAPSPSPSAEPSGPDAVLAAVLKETNGQGFDLDHQHQHNHAVPADDAAVPPSKEGLGSKTPDVAFGIAPSMDR